MYICDRSSFYKHGNDDDYFLCYDPNSDEWTQKCRIYEDYSKKVILATAKNNMYALIRDATVHLYDVQQNKWKKVRINNISDVEQSPKFESIKKNPLSDWSFPKWRKNQTHS